MNMLSDLRTALLDLLWELSESGIPLIVGGGYGLFLKAEYIRTHGLRTLLSEWPEARSTSDLDLFLRPELLIEPHKLAPLAEAINHLGYTVIPTAQKYQFGKPGPGNVGEIKIDFLTGPQSRFSGYGIKADSRRVHPNPPVGLHAHPLNEAPSLEEGLLAVHLSGTLTGGGQYASQVFVPHPYTYLMMKLFAFKDRFNDESKEYGRYHALDLYSIVATTTEDEWNAFPAIRKGFQDDPATLGARAIVTEHFSAANKMGIIRMRESRYFRPEMKLDDFISILQESFPA